MNTWGQNRQDHKNSKPLSDQRAVQQIHLTGFLFLGVNSKSDLQTRLNYIETYNKKKGNFWKQVQRMYR